MQPLLARIETANMYLGHERTQAMISRLARANGRSLRQAALDYGLPVAAFHAWATGRSLPSRLATPALAQALGVPADVILTRVAAERAARHGAPVQVG